MQEAFLRRRRGRRRRDDRVRHGHRQAGHQARPALQPSRARSRTTSRWSGRAGRDGEPSDCVLLAGSRDAADLRRFARADVPSRGRPALPSYRELRRRAIDGVACAAPRSSAPRRPARPRRHARAGRPRPARVRRRPRAAAWSCFRPRRTPARGSPSCSPARNARRLGAQTGSSAYGESGRCRQCADRGALRRGPRRAAVGRATAAPGPCGRPAAAEARAARAAGRRRRHDPRRGRLACAGRSGVRARRDAAPARCRRRRPHAATSRSARSARPGRPRSSAGSRAARARDISSGTRATTASRCCGLHGRTTPPRLEAPGAGRAPAEEDRALFERLRAWRRAEAAEAGVPAYVVLRDRTLRVLAAAQAALAGHARGRDDGFGAESKLERYGEPTLLAARRRAALSPQRSRTPPCRARRRPRGTRFPALPVPCPRRRRPRAPGPRRRRIRKLRLLTLVLVLGVLGRCSFSFGLMKAVASEIPSLDPANRREV